MFERQKKNHYLMKVVFYANYNLCSDNGNRLDRVLTIQWSPVWQLHYPEDIIELGTTHPMN